MAINSRLRSLKFASLHAELPMLYFCFILLCIYICVCVCVYTYIYIYFCGWPAIFFQLDKKCMCQFQIVHIFA